MAFLVLVFFRIFRLDELFITARRLWRTGLLSGRFIQPIGISLLYIFFCLLRFTPLLLIPLVLVSRVILSYSLELHSLSSYSLVGSLPAGSIGMVRLPIF